MKLGMNVVHSCEEWSSFVPTEDRGSRIEPPWRGVWSDRQYDVMLVPGVEYTCMISDGGTMAGVYHFGVDAPLQAGLEVQLHGMQVQSDKRIGIGWQNAYATLKVKSPLAVADLRLSLFPSGTGSERLSEMWRPEFLKAIEPFHQCWRAMGMCGIDSRVGTTMTAEEYGGFMRGPERWNDVDPKYGAFDKSTGTSPRFWFPPAERVWVNMPPVIAASPAERAKWISEVWRHGQHVNQKIVAIGNEIWATDKAIGRWFEDIGSHVEHRDPNVGKCLTLLRMTAQLKREIERAGLNDFKVVFEWQIGNRWPFEYDSYARRYVSSECRELLQEIGVLAIAPYAGRYITDINQLEASIVDEAREVGAWRQLLGAMGMGPNSLWAYEMSHMHFRNPPASWLRHPEVIRLAPVFLDAMQAEFGPNSVCCWFGLCERDQWGALRTLDDLNDPLYKALVRWAA